MNIHAYPAPAIASDYLRALTGLSLVGLPIVLAEPVPAVTALLVASAVLFAVYGAGTIHRHIARIELSEEGIRSRGLTTTEIRWPELRQLKLSHYSTRRDRSGGWLQLLLVGGGQRLRVDSRLEDFIVVAARATQAARENRIMLDPATLSNLEALRLTAASRWSAMGSAWG